MDNNFQLLVSADEISCKMYGDILMREGIKFEVIDENANAYVRSYGAQSSILGKNILVQSSNLEKAKEALGLAEKVEHIVREKKPIWFRIVVVCFLLPVIFMLVMIVTSVIKGFF